MAIQNFSFYNPTRILFGDDYVAEANSLIPADAKVLIVYGGGSALKNGSIEKAKEIIGNREYGMFAGIEPNPEFRTCEKCSELIKTEGYNFIFAVGGGSVIDAVKFISCAAVYDGPASDLLTLGYGKNIRPTQHMPFATILTLPATASEMNSGAVISYSEKDAKLPFMTGITFPLFSILDPRFTVSIPHRQIINGIVDPFIHICETYINTPVNARIQDRYSEGVLHTLIEVAPVILNDAENPNLAERANWMWAATNALNGFNSPGVPQDWGTHLMGHEITAHAGIDHAITLAMIYPAYLTVMFEQKKAKLAQMGERVFGLTAANKDELARKTIIAIRDFLRSVGAATSFKEMNLSQADVQPLLDSLKRHGLVQLGEGYVVNQYLQRQIYELAVNGIEA